MNDNPLTALRVSGTDRIEFLQGQFTQDLRQLKPGQPRLAGWTSPKGRLFFISWLADWQDSIWLVLPTALAEPVVRRLKMFILRADVRVDISELPVWLMAEIEPDKNGSTDCFNDDKKLRCAVDGTGWQIGGTSEQVQPSLAEWRLAHIRAGRPVIWQETSEDFVPQMVNLDLLDGISFAKGCYVGQEIVARTQNLGRIKRRMYRFQAAEGLVPVPGDVIKSGSHGAGKIVDAASTGDSIELLAVIRIESLQDELTLEDGRSLTQAPLGYAVPESVD